MDKPGYEVRKKFPGRRNVPHDVIWSEEPDPGETNVDLGP